MDKTFLRCPVKCHIVGIPAESTAGANPEIIFAVIKEAVYFSVGQPVILAESGYFFLFKDLKSF